MRRSCIGCRSWIADFQNSPRSMPWSEVFRLQGLVPAPGPEDS
jgi:hypothetical protein